MLFRMLKQLSARARLSARISCRSVQAVRASRCFMSRCERTTYWNNIQAYETFCL